VEMARVCGIVSVLGPSVFFHSAVYHSPSSRDGRRGLH